MCVSMFEESYYHRFSLQSNPVAMICFTVCDGISDIEGRDSGIGQWRSRLR